MNLSINPIYECNLNCSWCYLSTKQRKNPKTANLLDIEDRIIEVAKDSKIDHVDIYGGEVSLLPEEYLDRLYGIIRDYTDAPINVVTNLLEIHPFFLKKTIDLSVSFDYKARPEYEKVWSNMLFVDRPISVLMLVTKELVKYKPHEVLKFLNLIPNIKSLELKPYSKSRHNKSAELEKSYTSLVKWLIKNKRKAKFEIVNEKRIMGALAGQANPFSDDHVYITPAAKFAVLDFDGKGREYFRPLKNIDEYYKWAKNEPNNIIATNFECQECEYWGDCLSEHLHPFKCTGYKELLNWYQEEILDENNSQLLEHWAGLEG